MFRAVAEVGGTREPKAMLWCGCGPAGAGENPAHILQKKEKKKKRQEKKPFPTSSATL